MCRRCWVDGSYEGARIYFVNLQDALIVKAGDSNPSTFVNKVIKRASRANQGWCKAGPAFDP